VIDNVSEWNCLFGRISGQEERESENYSLRDAVHLEFETTGFDWLVSQSLTGWRIRVSCSLGVRVLKPLFGITANLASS
jgi:hypothetical protein